MSKNFSINTGKIGIHIITRDIRVEDNKSLYHLAENVDKIHLLFCFTPEQVGIRNKFRSERALHFMIQSLSSFSQSHPISFFKGTHEQALEFIQTHQNFHVVSISEDYTPYAKNRQSKLKSWCEKKNIKFMCTKNHSLVDFDTINGLQGKPYKVFTHFYNNAKNIQVKPYTASQYSNKIEKFSQKVKFDTLKKITSAYNLKKSPLGFFWEEPSRKKAENILQKLKNHKAYETERNRVDIPSSRLSAFLKFGLLGPRETLVAAQKIMGEKDSTPFIRELYFRDFYMYVAHHWGHVFGNNFKSFKHPIRWKNDETMIHKWKKGETGIPIVDAGMRELNETGFMHNRTRMVVAMFLTKNLLCDWRIGEEYFAQNLVDYDPCSNNGGWQWSASTGTDSSPYFRIMNPFTQSEKIDPECNYIKKYVPELANTPPKIIHNWDRFSKENDNGIYPSPIVDHKITRKNAIDLFKKIS